MIFEYMNINCQNLSVDIGFVYMGFDLDRSKEIFTELMNYNPIKGYIWLVNMIMGPGELLEYKKYCDNL